MTRLSLLLAAALLGCNGAVCVSPTPEFLETAPTGWSEEWRIATEAWEAIGAEPLPVGGPGCEIRLHAAEVPGPQIAQATQGGVHKALSVVPGDAELIIERDILGSMRTGEDCSGNRPRRLANTLIHELGHLHDARYPHETDNVHSGEEVSPMRDPIHRGCELHLPTDADECALDACCRLYGWEQCEGAA